MLKSHWVSLKLIPPVILLALAACATAPADKSAPATPAAARTVAPAASGFCLKDTGSRIHRSEADCTAVGRSYSRDDIDRTGAIDAGSALRLLDPSITVQGVH